MKRSILTLATLGVSGLAAGSAAGALLAGVRASDGGPDATALAAASPAIGFAAVLGAIALAVASGCLVAWTVGGGRALFAMGLVLLWPAVQSGTAEGIVRSAQSGAPLWRLAMEGALVGALVLAGAILVDWLAQRSRHAVAPPPTSRPNPRRVLIDAVVATAAAAVAMVFVAWIFAVEGLKGQAVASAIIAGLAGGLMARLAGGETRRWTFVAAAVLVAIWAPLWALRLHGSETLQAAYLGALFPPARLVPLDWLAGALLGGSLGWSWASGALHRESAEDAKTPSPA